MILNGMAPTLRPMLPADVEAATELLLGHGWGVRRDWLGFAAAQAACLPVIAEDGGRIVATGVGTANGRVGWIGSIFVDPEHRGLGLGRAITQAIIDGLEEAGCRTFSLVATTEGRRLYERMGFTVHTTYRILEIAGLPSGSASGLIRPFEAGDLDAMAALDRVGTGEDRRHAMTAFANPESAKVVVDSDGAVAGFVIRAPWGGGATIARSIDDAVRILTARRLVSGPDGRVRVGLLAENRAGHDRLIELGMRPSWNAPRMIRGEPLDWQPNWIWGQFNHAMG